MNNDLEGEYRIGITVRRQGENYAFSEEIKTEELRDNRELEDEVNRFVRDSLGSLEEELKDED